jgi:hypothetical protein
MINIDALNDDEKLAALESIHKSIEKSKEIQKKKITTNVELIVKALKKIESDFKQRYDETGKLIANLKNGEDGRDGKDGKDGKNGLNGRDGPMGPRGYDGLPGRNGIDGEDGVSITDAHIDFDGSLIISLSSGRVINVGEVVTPDIAEKIKVITNGGGTSQSVLDAIASLQAQISGITSGLDYQGTWNASTNTPALASGVGTNGYYYIVSVAGSTNLDGVTDWQIGDWAVFNGSVWQKLDQTDIVTSVAGRTGAVTLSNTDISGLGTMSTQNSSSVSISGGTVSGITDLAIADGGTGASTESGARSNLGATTIGGNLFTLSNPSAVRFPRFNADNTVSALDDASFRTAIGAGQGTVSSVAASVPSFLSVAGSPITSSGTLAITFSGTALPTANGGTGLTSFTADGVVYATSTSALETSGSLKFQTANSALTISSTTTAKGYIGFTNSEDGGAQGYIGNSKALMDTGGIDDAMTVRGENTLFFAIGSTEAMRLNSSGLGIGKSPGSALDVKGTIRLSGSTSGYVGLAPAAVAGSTTYTLPSADGTAGQALVTNGSGVLSFTDFTSGASGSSTQVQYNNGGSFAGSANLTFDGTTLTANALTTTSTVTINGGTANGVGYLNSSKVFTTGSALVFDGTNLLVGTTTSTYNNAGRSCIELNGSTDSLIAFKSGGTSSGYLYGGSSSLQLYAAGASTVLTFGTNGAERARIDTSGNFGLGVTPSGSWGTSGSAYKAMQFGISGFLSGRTGNEVAIFGTGAYNDGTNWKYLLNSNNASIYQQSSGAHTWSTAPASGVSGAGTNVTFTTAMTLDASGNLGVGTTTPTRKISIGGTSSAVMDFYATSYKRYAIGSDSRGFVIYDDSASAYRMEIDSAGNLGLGVTPSAGLATANYRLFEIGLDGGGSIYSGTNQTLIGTNIAWSGGTANYKTTGRAPVLYNQQNGAHSWSYAATGTAGTAITFTQAMTLDADGDLGIGVTSPAVRLDLQPATYTFGTSQAEVIRIRSNASGGTTSSATSVGAIVWGNGTTTQAVINSIIDNPSASSRSSLTFSTNIAGTLTEAARIDSSGNLGLGVTPSAWSASFKAIQVGSVGSVYGVSSFTGVGNNFFNDGTAKYITTNFASYYAQGSGSHAWYTAPSGTAGNAVTFTQAMTLDASGNLGIGTTTNITGARVDIRGANSNDLADLGAQVLTIFDTTSYAQNVGGGIALGYKYNTGGSVIQRGAVIKVVKENATDGNYASALVFGTTANSASTAERARIDSSGNLLVGTTSVTAGGAGQRVDIRGSLALSAASAVNGAYQELSFPAGDYKKAAIRGYSVGTTDAGELRFYTAPAGDIINERARIDSSGNLLVGTTTASGYRFKVEGGPSLVKYGDSSNSTSDLWNPATTGNNIFQFFYTDTTATARGSITYNRAAGLTSYNTTSDYRAKDISGSVTDSGALIDSVPVYIGKMKGATQERPMFIAHETPAYAHTGEKDAVDADGNPVYQQMDASALIPVMWAEIQSLRKRLADAGL